MNIKFALATATFLAMGFATTHLAAHNTSADTRNELRTAAAHLEGSDAGKSDRLARVVPSVTAGIRVITPSYLPSEEDGIDLVKIGNANLDPANRAFVGVVSWIDAQESVAPVQQIAAQ